MGMWRAHHEHVIGPGGRHDMQRPTSRNHGQRLGYGNVGQPHHRWNQGVWRSKWLHSDLTSTHQNTTDSRTSLRDFLFPIISRVCTAIEHWIKSYRTKKFPDDVIGIFHWHKILPIAWSWGRLSLYQKWVPGAFPRGKGGRCVRLTTLPPSWAIVT